MNIPTKAAVLSIGFAGLLSVAAPALAQVSIGLGIGGYAAPPPVVYAPPPPAYYPAPPPVYYPPATGYYSYPYYGQGWQDEDQGYWHGGSRWGYYRHDDDDDDDD